MNEQDNRYRWYRISLKDENLKPCVYTFRGATMKELRIAGTKPDKFEAEHYLLNKLVYPQKDWPTMLAGVVNKLLGEIYRYSGLSEEGLTFSEAVNWLQSDNGSLEAAAVAMIPSCSPDLLENADPFQYAKLLVMGKFMFETIYGIPVEQAFMQHAPDNSIDPTPNPGPATLPGPGEIGYQVEDSFTWKRKR
jgi:hypothetical protein